MSPLPDVALRDVFCPEEVFLYRFDLGTNKRLTKKTGEVYYKVIPQ
jgi:hypothetical protein